MIHYNPEWFDILVPDYQVDLEYWPLNDDDDDYSETGLGCSNVSQSRFRIAVDVLGCELNTNVQCWWM